MIPRLTSVLATQNRASTLDQTRRMGVVYSVITDETHPIFSTITGNVSVYIGSIQFRYNTDYVTSEDVLPIAFPINPNVLQLPIRNEFVDIYTGPDGTYYYSRLGYSSTTTAYASNSYISNVYDPDDNTSPDTYNQIVNTGLPLRNDARESSNRYGDYFNTPNFNRKLRLNEGDFVIESRFGQSIRFSAFNNPNRTFSPSVIIRNGENNSTDIGSAVNEDINRDSVIGMFSDGVKIPFIQGFISDSGRSNFNTLPKSFNNYPSEIKGNTILLNSDRIIISSRVNELMFFSKGNYGFISDGALSIDNRLGINASVGEDINIRTNNYSVNIDTAGGSINLGSTDSQILHPLVKGDELVAILRDILTEIANMKFLTPSGPSAIGPVNRSAFASISRRLDSILSIYNKTT